MTAEAAREVVCEVVCVVGARPKKKFIQEITKALG